MKNKLFEYKAGYDNLNGFLFLAPSLVFLVVFAFVPILGSLILGFFRWRVFDSPTWVGIQNFVDMFKYIETSVGREANDPRFYQAVGNNMFYMIQIPFHMAFSLCLALLINRRTTITYVFRTIYFMPVVTAMVAAAVIFRWVYQPTFGLLNSFLKFFGIEGPDWLGDTDVSKISIMLMNLWKNAGYQMLIYLAALQGVPENYYEAAKIDGASNWTQFWRITFPLIAPTNFFLLVMGVIWNLQMFPQIYVLTGGGPAGSTTSMVFYIYLRAFEDFFMGYASAVSLFLFMVIMAFTLIQWRLRSRWVFGEE